MTDNPDLFYNAFCMVCPQGAQGRVIIAMNRKPEAMLSVAHHFHEFHDEQNVMIQGESFLFGPAATYRCDMCNRLAEPPFYDYKVVPLQVPYDNDGLWLVCDGCHSLMGFFDALFARVKNIARGQLPYPDKDPFWLTYGAQIRRHYDLLTHRDAQVSRNTDGVKPT